MSASIPWSLLAFRLLIGSVVVVLSPYSIVASRGELRMPHMGAAMLVGAILIGLGLGAYFKSIWDFIHFAPTTVIATGMYRLVRNPMYAALVCILAGEAALTQLLVMAAYAATIWLALHLLVLLHEEPALARRFGSAYDAYRADVPRWFPRLRSAA